MYSWVFFSYACHIIQSDIECTVCFFRFFTSTYRAHVRHINVLFDVSFESKENIMCTVCPPRCDNLNGVDNNVIHCTECTARKSWLINLFFKIKSHQSQFVGLVHGILMSHFCVLIWFSFSFAGVS